MADNVELNVKSDLQKLIKELEKVAEKAGMIPAAMTEGSKQVEGEFDKQTKAAKTSLEKIESTGKKVFKALKDDLRSLASINAVQSALKLSDQFKGSISEGITLADTIRRLGPVFGIAGSEFAKFQGDIVKGMGDIGLSSEVATDSLKELAETPVRGKEALIEYSKAAGMLASVGGEKGKEGQIAKGMALTQRERGMDPNDVKAMTDLAEAVRKTHNVTGAGPTEILSQMREIFGKMPTEFRKTLSPMALGKVMAAGHAAGPGAMDFLKQYLTTSKINRMAMDKQGMAGVVTSKGLDTEKFQKFWKSITSRIGMDPRKAAETLGISEDMAEGFVRLGESMDKVKGAQKEMDEQAGDLTSEYRNTISMGDAFRSNLNKLKSFLSKPIAKATEGATNMLEKASQSNAGALAVAGGGGLLAALLAGGGLKGIGKGLFGSIGGIAKAEAIETATGRQVQPVYVTNAEDFGGKMTGTAGDAATAAGGLGGKLGGILKNIGAVAGAGAGGYAIGSLVSEAVKSTTQGTTDEGFQGDALERAMFKVLGKLGVGEAGAQTAAYKAQQKVDVHVETKSPNLKQVKPGTRGPSF